MPVNKYASSYLNAAYLRMVAAVDALEPTAFDMIPTSEQFEVGAKHLRDLGAAIDDYLHCFAREASSNSRSHISTRGKIALLSDALHDSGFIGELESEAYTLSEEEGGRSDFAEHNTHDLAHSGAR